MERNDIINAYAYLRRHNMSIPNDALDFILNASLKAFDDMEAGKGCENCKHDGNQCIFETACTGCCADVQFGHFKAK